MRYAPVTAKNCKRNIVNGLGSTMRNAVNGTSSRNTNCAHCNRQFWQFPQLGHVCTEKRVHFGAFQKSITSDWVKLFSPFNSRLRGASGRLSPALCRPNFIVQLNINCSRIGVLVLFSNRSFLHKLGKCCVELWTVLSVRFHKSRRRKTPNIFTSDCRPGNWFHA